MAEFEHFNTTPPADLLNPQGGDGQTVQDTNATVTDASGAQASQQTDTQAASTQDTQPDKFFEDFNKRYNTTYKTDDEIKSLFTLPGKVTEYEGKLKDHESLTKSVEQYKKDLEETKLNATGDLLSKPRIRSAYVAEQLIAKYPDRDADILAQVAMSDIDRMSDIEAIAKEKMISVKGLTLDEAKLAKLADFGIDATTPTEEWDSVAKARVKIAGAEARERIKQLMQGIEIPKAPSKEERDAAQAKALEDKVKAVAPVKETFKKFDKFKVGEFEYDVSDEFKGKLGDIFDGFFINGGLDVNEENIATAELLKEALFVKENLPKMLEVHEKSIRAKVKEETDKLLHNDTPPNTSTTTDQTDTTDPNRPGLKDFFASNKR